ncbi:unnamed protein product [Paramecium primaurelia]|uniref:Uncharacterized protein n=1 Tax=Paramecium primaurelia TaxID=5886 RepID=A0A8S1LQ56_PARPR|nr:unnamed protein product [Paramecium primaurelia]
MSLQRVFEKLLYWDVYLSAIIHGHESLMLTVMLFLPALIFSPTTIAAPIFFITYQYGYAYSIRYVISIVLSLVLTTFFKKHFKRPRPKPRPQLSLKPMYFRNKETNYSLPSGDCAQAATFLFYFLKNVQFCKDTSCSQMEFTKVQNEITPTRLFNLSKSFLVMACPN